MQTVKNPSLLKHILFEYTSFDRVVLRGYIMGLFVPGSVIRLLRNLGFRKHTNGVMRLLTDKLNSHIKKTAEKLDVTIHWWGEQEKKKYRSKIDFINDRYKKELAKKNKKSKVIAIVRATENTRTFANKNIKTKKGKIFTKMYAANKFVSHYYIYIDDEKLGLCYLKIASYLPFVSEFYFNGHYYLKKQFDLAGFLLEGKLLPSVAIQNIEKMFSVLSEIENNAGKEAALKYFFGYLEEKNKNFNKFVLDIVEVNEKKALKYFEIDENIILSKKKRKSWF